MTTTTAPLTVEEYATLLQEPNKRLLSRALRFLGPERCEATLQDALTCEAGDGLLRANGERRTPGGTFFHFLRASCTAKERWRVFVLADHPERLRRRASPPVLTVTLAEALASMSTHLHPGRGTVKMTLVGRPKESAAVDAYVVTQLEAEAPKSLPKGLPQPPTTPTLWTVFVSAKQWATVAPALRKDPEDKLVIDGKPCVVDGRPVLFATSVTTPALSRAKSESTHAQ